MSAKVSIAFLNTDTDAELIIDIGRIIVALTNNAYYVTPMPTLADVSSARDQFIAAVNALDGSIAATATRDERRASLVTLARSLAMYVQQACNGDLVTLLSSGHSAHKAKQPVGLLAPPLNLRLTRTDMSGQIKARCDKVNNANSYQWRSATTAAPATWTLIPPTTAARIILNDLTPGTSYVVQVRAIGSQGPSDWSDAATLMAV